MNRFSPTHFFSSTMMRCITAICPAGPPKLSAATRSQTRNASGNETPWLGATAGRPDDASEVSVTAAALPAPATANHGLMS